MRNSVLRRGAVTAAIVLAASLLTACSTGATTTTGTTGVQPPKIAMKSSLGTGEGQLNIIVWAGYAEDGTNDKTVDWVHPFEQATGCQVHAKVGNTSDEMVQLMRTGQYDGVSASGDATLRLIYAGDVAPVNTSLVPNYKTISAFLKNGNGTP
jgi:putative spermidine/putrescine transport system substrate-binding protein